MRLSKEVVYVNAKENIVRCRDGELFKYDKLLISTGSLSIIKYFVLNEVNYSSATIGLHTFQFLYWDLMSLQVTRSLRTKYLLLDIRYLLYTGYGNLRILSPLVRRYYIIGISHGSIRLCSRTWLISQT